MEAVEHHFTAMGGPCHLRLECESDMAELYIDAAKADVQRLEERYSRYRSDSLTSRINAAAGQDPIPIDAETAGLLHYADTLWRESGGLFDLTSGILRKVWDFRSGRVPEPTEIDALLPLVGWDKVEWTKESLRLPQEGMELDFGGLVKEYACDSAANRLKKMGLSHGLVDLAGDIVAIGRRADGRPWPIGIRHPQDENRAIAQIQLSNEALASSGDYERCMIVDGERLSHILNPETGRPVGGLVAVSVVADQCLVAGSSTTVAMLKPQAEGLEWLHSLGLPWLAIDREMRCHGSIANADGG